MIRVDLRNAACGRHFDSVSSWKSPIMPSEVQMLREENALLKERTRALTALVTDLSKMLDPSESTS